MNDTPAGVKLDPEFEHLIPPLAPDELAQLERSLQQQGCRDPLVVWKEQQLVLDGHNRFRVCRKHAIRFQVVEVSVADREAARAFIIRNQMSRRNLSPEALSYLRGKRYLEVKRQGERHDLTSGQSDQKTTAALLAEEYRVGEKTVRRDAKFAGAVDVIAGNCGADATQWVLARDVGLTRSCVVRVARMTPKAQQRFIDQLRQTGKAPRVRSARKTTLRVSTEPAVMVVELIEFLGPRAAAAIARRIHKALQEAGGRAGAAAGMQPPP